MKGEIVKAVIVLKPSEVATEQELIDFCRERLADYKVPRVIEFRNEPLPRSRTGKIKKGDLIRESETASSNPA